MNNFNEIRSFSPEEAAEKIFHELLSPAFLNHLSSFYAVSADCIGSKRADEAKSDFVNAVTCWLKREPEESSKEDWFETYLERLRLFTWYENELDMINGEPVNDVPIIDLFCTLYTLKDTDWIDIKVEDGRVGFLVIGYGNNTHPDADYYIQEAFVMNGYRKRGLMSRALSDYMKDHEGCYVYYVLRKNMEAKYFWNSFFKKAGYHIYPLYDMGNDNLLQFGWKK